MMRQFELLERVQRYNPAANEDLLNKAYIYSMQKHGLQKRASGDPYFSHPLEVAAILTDLHLDDATIAVGLLHDTIEDTTATRSEIDTLFGDEIGHLVDGLTKIKRLNLDTRKTVSKQAEQAENLRKLLLAISDDIRVLLVKLADRLHNMRTLDHIAPEKRARIAKETIEIYAPLAGRMGMQDMRDELESLAFSHSNPLAYKTVSDKLKELSEKNQNTILQIQSEIKQKLEAENLTATVISRQKKPYSVFRKMEQKSISFEQLSDIIGFRIITEDIHSCYRILGLIHTAWPAVPGRFKDYISVPKQNDYRSIHTTVVGPAHQRVELQIRTKTMHSIAEYGIAAHSLYKDGLFNRNFKKDAAASKAYTWLSKTIETLVSGDTPEEFLENTKLELFHDQVFCFTPKGRLIALPQGATPIDFAYAVHTDIGNTCVGCKINGRIVGLANTLKNGDEVEIMTMAGRTPPWAWEKIAFTGRARSAIRRANRLIERRRYITLADRMLETAFHALNRVYDPQMLNNVLDFFNKTSVDDLKAALGSAQIKLADVIRNLFPDDSPLIQSMTEEAHSLDDDQNTTMPIQINPKYPSARLHLDALPIAGPSGDLPVRFAPNSGAVPGDKIVGILTQDKGITIYPIHSKSLKEFDKEPERWLDVKWDVRIHHTDRFPAQIRISITNEPGSLAKIANIIGDTDGNIDNIKMTRRSHDFTEMIIDLEVWNLEHLLRIIRQIRHQPNVALVERTSI